MATIHCPCGDKFGDGEIPCPHLYAMIPDTAMEELVESRLSSACKAGDVATDQMYSALQSLGIRAYRCPGCGRMLIFWYGVDKPAQAYRAE